MKKTTILELINKMARGEEVPKYINYNGIRYKLNKGLQDYINESERGNKYYLIYDILGDNKIHKLNDIVYYREELLDKEEKKYLENVLRPYKNFEIDIKMHMYNTDEFYLDIEIHRNSFIISSLVLPPFAKNTMYKKLKLHRVYNIDDLGLFED